MLSNSTWFWPSLLADMESIDLFSVSNKIHKEIPTYELAEISHKLCGVSLHIWILWSYTLVSAHWSFDIW